MTRTDDKRTPPEGLSDGTVAIRPLLAADTHAFVQAFRDDPRLGVMIGSERDPDEDEVAAQVAEPPAPGRVPTLAIADATSGEFLGSIGVYRFDEHHRRGEVGFWLRPDARGRGIAKRAVRLVTSWAFDGLGCERVEITTTPDNEATLRLAAGLGFVEEGVMRERNRERGQRVDVVMLSVLKREWRG